MSDREIIKETAPASKSEVQKSIIDEVYDFGKDTIAHPDARARQAFVAGYGLA